jgi:hypothetical protein
MTPDQIRALCDLIWDYHQEPNCFDELLTATLDSSLPELAIKLLILKQLDEINGNLDKIAVEGLDVKTWDQDA